MCLFSGLCLPTKPNFGPLEWYLKKFKSNLVAEIVGEASYGKSSFMLIHDGVSMSPIKTPRCFIALKPNTWPLLFLTLGRKQEQKKIC